MVQRSVTRPRYPLVALAALAGAALTGCSAPTPTPSGNGGEVTGPVEETADAEVLPLALNADGILGGTATVKDFDAGEQGVITVVSIGTFAADSGSLPFVFRNNTAEAISHVDASATVRDSAGALVSNGRSQGTIPAQIQPGALGLAYIYLEQGGVPEGAKFEFKFETSSADTSSYNTGDLKVTEVSATADGIIGTASNQTDADQVGPYSVDVYCFDESGSILSTTRDFANEDSDVAPAGTVSFSSNFYGNSCPTFLVGVTGYFK